MDDGLKQRLIGAIVLLALCVIFLPVIFDRDPIKPVDQETKIPSKPEVITLSITEPAQPEAMDLAPEPTEMYIPDEIEEVNLAPEPVSLSKQGVPKSWVLQVSSFRDDKRAKAFRDTLLDADYPAYSRRANNMSRVYVGPKLDKSSLTRLKQKVDKEYKVKSIVLEFKAK